MKLKILAAVAALMIAVPAYAHDGKGKHGGRVADAGDYHVELVSNGAAIEVYVSDHDDKPVALAGYKGLAILSAGGKSQRIILEVRDGTKLTGKASVDLPAQPKGVVQITPPNGKTVSAKF